MNNGATKTNIMTWNTFKKKFNPTIYSVTDSTFGTKSTIEPTMRRLGFMVNTLYDVDHYKKPMEIIKESFNLYEKTYIIYHPFKYRDGRRKRIMIFIA